jgi:beta-glucosidase-like glycosyl hydrolase/CubicO group peptidase (beta-lactamase class C family)
MFKFIKIVIFLLFSFILQITVAQSPLISKDSVQQKKWVDSLLQKLTIDQKIGQLFMLAAYSNKDNKHTDYLKSIIKKHEIGGLIFMQGTPKKQALLNNEYQKISKIPLLIGVDGEWGLDMRLKNTYRFPWNMTLGAIRDNHLVEEFGKRLGEQCKRLGIHVNFAPVVDINTNPNNPIIGNRSFGENKYNVTYKALAFTKGMQSKNVLACAKHFPGHGDTNTDSHKTLPSVNFSEERIDSVELYPYKVLFENGLASIMAAHLNMSNLTKSDKLPTSLSYNVLNKLLRNKLKFKGLVFTDALNMKGVSTFVEENKYKKENNSTKGKIDLKALLAGNDILLFSEDILSAKQQIKKALKSGTLTEDRINQSVKRILQAKYLAGLNNYKPVRIENLQEDLNTINDEILHRKLIENAITLIKNENAIFPIRNLDKNRIAYLKLGESDNYVFKKRLQDYSNITILGKTEIENYKLDKYDIIIIGVHKSNANPWKSYKISNDELQIIQKIAKSKKVILNVFASPYALMDISDFSNIEAVLLSYQNSTIAQDISAQIIFGALGAKGMLPVTINDDFKAGFGLRSANLFRLKFGFPEEEKMSTQKLNRIDSIAKIILDKKMSPGMQILVARNGKVVFRRNYGHYTAKKTHKVTDNSIYDIASLTKILGALPQIMKAEEQGKFDLDDTFGKIFPVTKGSNKDTVTIREALSHVGRLQAWIPFYKKTLDSISKKPSLQYYRRAKEKGFNIRVAKDLYLRDDYIDTIYQAIADAPQRNNSGYKYSGFAFYLFKDYLEKLYKKPLDKLDDKLFFKPIGATTLTYNPLQKFNKERIVPTEKDNYFRYQLLQGYVHDMGASMLGGVSGNAGLFSNSLDVAKMMQMYLQKGYYGGKRYLKTKTIDKFNHRYYLKDSVRRGLGFDKPQLNPDIMATCGCVSDKSFGHSGFTGALTWADPKSGIVYVFLSNRVYPTMENKGMVKEDIRAKVQQLVQDAIIE